MVFILNSLSTRCDLSSLFKSEGFYNSDLLDLVSDALNYSGRVYFASDNIVSDNF